MIKLSLSRDPEWHEIIPGVRILAAPITTGLWMAARSDPGVVSAAAGGEAPFAVALTGYIAKNTIREWVGVGDADGNPVAPSPEWVDALMAHFPAYEGFSAAVMRPWLEVIAEGNVYAPSPNGTLAGAPDIAKDARASAQNARGSKKRPLTAEGATMWALVTRLGGQRRIAIGAGGAIMIGWDMGAAFELSRALGLPDWLVAEWLPAIESAAVAATNEGRRTMNEDISVRLAVVGGTEFRREVEGAGTEIQRLIAQTTGLAPVQSNAAASATAFTGALSQEREAFQRLLGALDPATAALQRYERDLQEVTIAERLGVATREEAARATLLLRERLEASTGRLGAFGTAAAASSVGTGALGRNATNAAFQVQDFVVQVTGGTNAVRALSMQLPQLLGGFGLLGAAAGAAVAIIGGLVMAFTSTGDAADDAKPAVDGFTEALRDYVRLTELAQSGTDDLAEKYGQFAGQVQENSEFLRQVALRNAFDALREDIVPIEGALETVRERAAEVAIYMQRVEEAANLRVPGIDAMRDALEATRDDLAETASELGLSVDQAVALANALDAVETAAETGAGVGAIANLASEALAVMQQIEASGLDLPGPLREAAAALGEIADQSAAAAAASGSLVQSLLDGSAAASLLRDLAPSSGWLAGAIEDATRLASVMWSAASARAAVAQQQQTETENRVGQPRNGPAPINAQVVVRAPSSGGGGGGGRNPDAAEAERLFEQTRTASERLAAELANLDGLYRRGAIDAELYGRAQDMLRQEFEQTTDSVGGMTDVLRDGLGGLFDSIIEGGKSAAEVISDVAKRLASMALQSSAFSLLSGLAPGIFGAGGWLPLTPSANGNVFSGGNLTAFASGGVLTAPAVFPMANGGVGLAGEAGPEAIMPLRRIGGRLGVDAAGMGGGQVIVQNIDQRSGGAPVQTETRRGPNGETYIINTIRDAEARGDMDKVRGQRFGSRVGKVMR